MLAPTTLQPTRASKTADECAPRELQLQIAMRRRGREPIHVSAGMLSMTRLSCARPQPKRYCPQFAGVLRPSDDGAWARGGWFGRKAPLRGFRWLGRMPAIACGSPAPRLAALACGIAQLPPKVADTQATDALGFISAGLGRLLYLCLLVCARFHAGEPGAGRRTATRLRAIGRAVSRRPHAVRAQCRKNV